MTIHFIWQVSSTILISAGLQAKWRLGYCFDKLPFICEIPVHADPQVVQPPAREFVSYAWPQLCDLFFSFFSCFLQRNGNVMRGGLLIRTREIATMCQMTQIRLNTENLWANALIWMLSLLSSEMKMISHLLHVSLSNWCLDKNSFVKRWLNFLQI